MPSLDINYISSSSLAEGARSLPLYPLGVIGFGTEDRPAGLASEAPFIPIDIPSLTSPAIYEAWSADRPVTYGETDGFRHATTGDVLFGAIQRPQSAEADMEALAYDCYSKLLNLTESAGFGGILRIWNYFPGITEVTDSLERYRRFSLGRHEAFVAHRRKIETAPAACAIGSKSGPLTIYFLASRTNGRPIENPRQESAYHYPSQYGPRSPTFSRATLGAIGRDETLFISGTASIVGHESRHPGDPRAQSVETIANIRALIAEMNKAGLTLGPQGLTLKVYVRHGDDLDTIQRCVTELLDRNGTAIYLHADICRPDLLMEIEAVGLALTRPA